MKTGEETRAVVEGVIHPAVTTLDHLVERTGEAPPPRPYTHRVFKF